MLQAVAQDASTWWRSGEGDVPSQSFCEYVRGLNAESGVEVDADANADKC